MNTKTKKRDLLKKINELVWANEWDGDMDPDALIERIEDLLVIEADHKRLQKQLREVTKSIRELMLG